jgi:hypothetical protein
MSIKYYTNEINLIFQGDWGVGSGKRGGLHALSLAQIPKGEPGRQLNDQEQEMCHDDNNLHITLLFEDVRSIDAIIKELQFIKEAMINAS